MRYFILILGVSFLLASESRGQSPASSGTIITLAGNGIVSYSGDGGPATNASLNFPYGFSVGRDGTLYFSDSGNYRVRAINPTNGIIRTVVGSGPPSGGFCNDGPNGDGGQATNASVCTLISVPVDRARNTLYVSDWSLLRVRTVNLGTGVINNFAGVGSFYPYPELGIRGDGGPAEQAWFAGDIWATALDGVGNVFILEGCRIRRVNISTGIIQTIAGQSDSATANMSDVCECIGDGGPAAQAALRYPSHLTVDRAGNIFTMELLGWSPDHSYVIRRISAATGIITRIAGGGPNPPTNGLATNLFFPSMTDIAVNTDGDKLFFASTNQVYIMDVPTGTVALFAGNGTNGFSGDGGPALAAKFDSITALAVAPDGGLLIGDRFNSRVRYVVPDSVRLVGDSGQTEMHLPWISQLTGDLILSNNTNLTNVTAGSLTNVGGVVSVSGNTAAGVLDLGSLAAAGTVSVTGNTAAGNLDLSSLETVSGDLIVSENTAAGDLNLGSLGSVSGNLIITENTSAGVLDLSSLESAGTIEISGNTEAGNLDLSSLAEASGNLTIESNAPDAVVNLANFTTYGCGTNDVTMTLNGGTVEMTNGLILCTNATLTGSTTVDGSITNNGTIDPGSSPGRLNITGLLHLNNSSRLKLEIGGYDSNEFDVVHVGNAIKLGGALSVSLHGNFKWAMTNGSSFTVATSGTSLAGSFANAGFGALLTTTDGYARFTVLAPGDNSVRLVNLQVVDTDSDSMPDWWEDHFGLGKTNAADAELDLDGDQSSNAAEFAAGTDPTNPASVFRLLSILSESNGVRLIWNAMGGRSYHVQTNGTLPGVFTDNGALVIAPGTGEFITNILNPEPVSNHPARYYRLRIGP